MPKKSKTAAESVATPVPETAPLVIEAPEDIAALMEIEQSGAGEDLGYDELRAAIGSEDADGYVRRLTTSLDERAAFENAKDISNMNIHRTLKSCRAALARRAAGKALMIAGVDPDFVNRQLHDGSRYNVYALKKLADVVDGLNGGLVGNEINRAIIRSLYALADAGKGFTMEIAKMCCSKNYTAKGELEAGVRSQLFRYTVAPGTASTQASSTMQALQTLGVVTASGGKNTTYTLTKTPIAAKLRAVMTA